MFCTIRCEYLFFFFFQAEDGIRDWSVTGVQTCALPIWSGRCASAQIARQLAILGNEQARPAQRNESLKWIVHLVGDIHQPLHAANHADRGGNRVEVSFFGERDNPPYGSLNLHAVWDVPLVRRLIADRHGERAWIAAAVSEAQRAEWSAGSVPDWVAESHALARDSAYAALPVPVSCSHKTAGI